jgi:D-alanyl-D-alanine carboxypeptidase
MTAVVALENLSDFSQTISFSEETLAALEEADASVAGFEAGEEARVIDLLYGLMLPSGAECGIGLAELVAGSESAFADLMNSKAAELGMADTHFTNTSGLPDDEHYSTAQDIATLLRYAIELPGFYDIFTTPEYSTPPTDEHEDGLTFKSTLFADLPDAGFEDGAILGGKTGFTNAAGRCLASLAEKFGERFILVTGGAPIAEPEPEAPEADPSLGDPEAGPSSDPPETAQTSDGPETAQSSDEPEAGSPPEVSEADPPLGDPEAPAQGEEKAERSKKPHIVDAFTVYEAITQVSL